MGGHLHVIIRAVLLLCCWLFAINVVREQTVCFFLIVPWLCAVSFSALHHELLLGLQFQHDILMMTVLQHGSMHLLNSFLITIFASLSVSLSLCLVVLCHIKHSRYAP